MNHLTADKARDLMRYEPETGKLYWRVNVGLNGRIPAGTEAGNIKKKQSGNIYREVKNNGRKYYAHRLIWLIVTGEWPAREIDHIDGNGLNNRWENLRDASRTDNMHNRKRYSNNTSGAAGVYWRQDVNKWHSQIRVNGVSINLGYFENMPDAIKARKAAERKYGFHENHGRPS